ncbi:MAG TPA: Sec-independent protein translocase protein TatB [Rhodanobacteraceae bacterium]|jgi:sec-independent protein translocase protein TatB|nr:Sec-independent protein translocase protein TatB [Rhodanobacteraceae bacterium]
MIDLSYSKLLLLAVIALIVLGPEKLPKAARMAGAMVRRVRLGWDSVRSEVEREIQMEEIKRNAREAAAQVESVRAAADGVSKDARAVVDESIADVKHVASDGDHPDGHA